MMDISALNLAPNALAGALQLKAKHPNVVFTSGRRNAAQQAHAMATNIVATHNRKWIEQTYHSTPESRSLQAWVDAHPSATATDQLTAGFFGIMESWTDAQKRNLSRHFSGEAWDVRPIPGPDGGAVKATIISLPHLTKFIEHEGGLVRWHAQFRDE
jgi:hypothetical protein